MRIAIPLVLAAAALAGPASPATAGLITTIDQQNTVDGQTSGGGISAFGQSFTPTLNRIDAAGFTISTGSATLVLNLYNGAGTGGTLLGTSGPQAVSTSGFQEVDFRLTSPVTLTPGNVYTLYVTATSGTANLEFSSNNPYAGGAEYSSSGMGIPTVDAIFVEGLVGLASVPEPSSMAMMGAGLIAALGYARARRRRAA